MKVRYVQAKLSKLIALTILFEFSLILPTLSHAGTSDRVVEIINTQFGRVCKAEVSGWFSKTLKMDWTENTVKLHTLKIFAEIGSVKEELYNDGVRYFQFPNDKGTYNVIDWKTGEKWSIKDRAPYYFAN